ncbi:MAG: adaptor protein MecA [Lachnospiraceae bacterium]|nr:adaptor protein MecA [Lachnospiraceae bacterium]
MTIERLSDTQIRCTLNKQDLQERQLQLSELFYGSEKAKELFHDLMQMASYECGFDTEDLPLMIEAIPVDADCLVLVVTKVEDSDELDSRFSNFTPFTEKNNQPEKPAMPALADEILNYFSQFKELLSKKASELSSKTEAAEEDDSKTPASLVKMYRFDSLQALSRFASIIAAHYCGSVKLYKNASGGAYYLLLDMLGHTAEEFNKLCNIASEYGNSVPANNASLLYYQEHFNLIDGENLLETLARLS